MTMTTRPAHVPAPIARVDGDTDVMRRDHLRREAQAASRKDASHPYALTWYGAEVYGVNVVLYRTAEGRDIGIDHLPADVMFEVWPPAPAEAAPVDAPAPTDPRDAEIAALTAEVAALRDMRKCIIDYADNVLRYEKDGMSDFYRGSCSAYKTVMSIIKEADDTRTSSTPAES